MLTSNIQNNIIMKFTETQIIGLLVLFLLCEFHYKKYISQKHIYLKRPLSGILLFIFIVFGR